MMLRFLFLLACLLLASNAVARFTGAGSSGEDLRESVRKDGSVVASLTSVARSLGLELREIGECKALVLENGVAVAKVLQAQDPMVDLVELTELVDHANTFDNPKHARAISGSVLRGCPVSVDDVQEFFNVTVEDLGHRMRLCDAEICYSIPKTPPKEDHKNAPDENVLMAAPYIFAEDQGDKSFICPYVRGQEQEKDCSLSSRALQSWFTSCHDGLGPGPRKVAAALSDMTDAEVVGTIVAASERKKGASVRDDVSLWHWTGEGVSQYGFVQYDLSFFDNTWEPSGPPPYTLSTEFEEGFLVMGTGEGGLHGALSSSDNATVQLLFEGLAGDCSALKEVFLCFETPDGVLLASTYRYQRRLEISKSVLGPNLLSAAKDWARARENAVLDDPRARNFRLLERKDHNQCLKITRNDDVPEDAASWRRWMKLEQGADMSMATTWISKPDELLLGRITVAEFQHLFHSSWQSFRNDHPDVRVGSTDSGMLFVNCNMVGDRRVLSLSEDDGFVSDCGREDWLSIVETIVA